MGVNGWWRSAAGAGAGSTTGWGADSAIGIGIGSSACAREATSSTCQYSTDGSAAARSLACSARAWSQLDSYAGVEGASGITGSGPTKLSGSGGAVGDDWVGSGGAGDSVTNGSIEGGSPPGALESDRNDRARRP